GRLARPEYEGRVKADTRVLRHEPPGTAEPGERTRRRALRSLRYDGGKLLRADQRSNADTREQAAALALEHHGRFACGQRRNLGSECFDVAEIEPAFDDDQRRSVFELLDIDLGGLSRRQRKQQKDTDADTTHGHNRALVRRRDIVQLVAEKNVRPP